MEEIKKALKNPIVQTLVATAILGVYGLINTFFGLQAMLVSAIVSAVLFLTVLLLRPKLRPRVFSHKQTVLATPASLPASGTIPQSGLIAKFSPPLRRNQIVAKVHDDFSLEPDDQIMAAFNDLNSQRLAQNKKPHYRAPRFRLIYPHQFKEMGIELHLAPVDFALFALLKDPNVPASVKEHVREQAAEVARNIPKWLQSTHPIMNGHNCHPLGIEMVVVTKDGKTRFQRRGASVLLDSDEWDVSYSGYCGNVDRLRSGELDLGLTAENELRREIGVLSADSREIAFTGLYLHPTTGGVDILGIWQVEAKTSELVEFLDEKYPGIEKVFETTKRAEEQFVWDSKNLIVDFNGSAISQALKKIGSEEGKPSILIPEARMSLILGLEATGQSASELAF